MQFWLIALALSAAIPAAAAERAYPAKWSKVVKESGAKAD